MSTVGASKNRSSRLESDSDAGRASKSKLSSYSLFSDSDDESEARKRRQRRFATCGHQSDTAALSRSRMNADSHASGKIGGSKVHDSDVHSDIANEDKSEVKSYMDKSLYRSIDLSMIGDVPHNTKIMYVKTNGDTIFMKYFKKYDPITNDITLGFYTSDDKNYDYSIKNVSEFLVEKETKVGAAEIEKDKLRDAIEIKQSEWKDIAEGTVISYRKKDKKMVYKVKFDKYVKLKKDGSTRIAFIMQTGKSYLANPSSIDTIYRHMSGSDKIMATVLKQLMILEKRIERLEKKVVYKK
jgi:hypothetical protein